MYCHSYVFKWCGYNASIRTSIIGFYILRSIYMHLLFMVVWLNSLENIVQFNFFKDIAPAGLNAFGTCSSSATIPISLKCASEKIGIPEEITSLTLPLGATINMDAVSILMSFMITFFATALGIDLSIGTMVTVLACNVLLSIGTQAFQVVLFRFLRHCVQLQEFQQIKF